jgi:hypothetical protein
MRIASEPIDDRYRRRAARLLAFAVLLVACSSVAQLMAMRWHRLRWRGEVAQARVVDRRTWTTRTKSAYRRHCAIAAELPDGRRVDDEAALFVCSEGSLASVPWTYLPGDASVGQIGDRELGVSAVAPMPILMLLVALAIAFAAIEQKGRRWFERRAVVDVVPGRLPPP